jgi:type IV secretory pathway component VirB8
MASYSPRKSIIFEFHRCHWHRWNDFSGVINTAETISVVSLTPLKRFQQCHWHRWTHGDGKVKNFIGTSTTEFFLFLKFSGINDAAETISAVSLTRLKRFLRCHWHRWNYFRGVIDTTETISMVSMTPLKLMWHTEISIRLYKCFFFH